jgi:hypothetical protein
VRIRHLALAVIGVAAAAALFQAVAGTPGGTPPVLDDGTINVTASEDGRGAWVPYTLTVRNLGDHDFSGRLLLEKLAALRCSPCPESATSSPRFRRAAS